MRKTKLNKTSLKEELTELWTKNFQKFLEVDIDQREYGTKVSPPPEVALNLAFLSILSGLAALMSVDIA